MSQSSGSSPHQSSKKPAHQSIKTIRDTVMERSARKRGHPHRLLRRNMHVKAGRCLLTNLPKHLEVVHTVDGATRSNVVAKLERAAWGMDPDEINRYNLFFQVGWQRCFDRGELALIPLLDVLKALEELNKPESDAREIVSKESFQYHLLPLPYADGLPLCRFGSPDPNGVVPAT